MKNCGYCGGEPELQATRTATGVSAFVRCGVCGRSVTVNAATIAEAANEVERRWETETRGEAIMKGMRDGIEMTSPAIAEAAKQLCERLKERGGNDDEA